MTLEIASEREVVGFEPVPVIDGAEAPVVGDSDIHILYAAVGEAMARWEVFELAFANLYSRFAGYPYWLAKVRHFGASNPGFAQRLEAIEAAADRFFDDPAQAEPRERDNRRYFRDICRRAAILFDVRDRIAQGLARPAEGQGGEVRFVLQPPWHIDPQRIIEHAIGSREIANLSQAFVDLAEDTDNLNRRYVAYSH
jgi:hypothetical protein